MGAPKNVSHVSAPREMRLETDSPRHGTGRETDCETTTTKRLIDKVLARSLVRQTVRQPLRQGVETVRQSVRQPPGEPPSSPLSVPPDLAEALLCCGYCAPEWTPEGCRQFLAELQAEWPDFHVNGWHGCRFPPCWPGHLMDAVQSVYVMSIQDQGGA